MTGILGRFVSLEMALLGVCELALSFLVIYAMLNAPGAVPLLFGYFNLPFPELVARDTANLAALLACTVELTAAAIGRRRPFHSTLPWFRTLTPTATDLHENKGTEQHQAYAGSLPIMTIPGVSLVAVSWFISTETTR